MKNREYVNENPNGDKVTVRYMLDQNQIIFKEFVFEMESNVQLNWSHEAHVLMGFLCNLHGVKYFDSTENEYVKVTIVSPDDQILN